MSNRRNLLSRLYAGEIADHTFIRIEELLAAHGVHAPVPPLTPDDVWLITYADQFQESDVPPLATLSHALEGPLEGIFNGVHILPFYPWTSDDGFAVTDYREVDSRYGTWADVEAIAASHRLMADAVVNHMSSESEWFQQFLQGAPSREAFFATGGTDTDTSSVTRPRTHPLLTPFTAHDGTRLVWTTFSADQVDLNYANPDVLVEVIDVILGYAARGAQAIRLDAIGFAWKDPSRSSIHLPETHAIVKLLRSCLDQTYPGVLVITETNVPHAENVSYLNIEEPEAHAVYQFPLAPLVAHAALTGDSSALCAWAASVNDVVEPGATFLNFLASHDGIGVRPAEGILSASDIGILVDACRDAGGQVSMRSTPDGEAPYELNTTWFDLMSQTIGGHRVAEETAIARHIATHAVMMLMPGVPAVYIHSLLGSSNDVASYAKTGMNRTLNREKLQLSDTARAISDPSHRSSKIIAAMTELVRTRRSTPALHPEGDTTVLAGPPGTFGVARHYDGQVAVGWVNLTGNRTTVGDVTLGPYGYNIA